MAITLESPTSPDGMEQSDFSDAVLSEKKRHFDYSQFGSSAIETG
jgi:hypothetical protein